MNITEYIFEAERVYFSDLIWQENRTFKERQLKRIPEWRIIDSNGKVYGVEITHKENKNNFLGFIFGNHYQLKLNLVFMGETYELRRLIDELLKKSKNMFHIYHNKILTLEEYENKLKNATSFLEVIDIASFEDYKEN